MNLAALPAAATQRQCRIRCVVVSCERKTFEFHIFDDGGACGFAISSISSDDILQHTYRGCNLSIKHNQKLSVEK